MTPFSFRLKELKAHIAQQKDMLQELDKKMYVPPPLPFCFLVFSFDVAGADVYLLISDELSGGQGGHK